MNNEKKTIKEATKLFYSSRPLSDIQQQSLQALQQRLEQSENITDLKKSHRLHWIGSIAASFLLFIVAFSFAHTPAVITAAYADTVFDADLNNGMQASMSQWLSEKNIGNVPQKYPVEMSKFCKLDKYKTTHLRIAGAEQGTVHLFFHQGDRPMYWLNRTGSVDEMNWEMIKVSGDLTVIVLYTDDMRESAIQNILGKMLTKLQA